jgi:hypothetical protein
LGDPGCRCVLCRGRYPVERPDHGRHIRHCSQGEGVDRQASTSRTVRRALVSRVGRLRCQPSLKHRRELSAPGRQRPCPDRSAATHSMRNGRRARPAPMDRTITCPPRIVPPQNPGVPPSDRGFFCLDVGGLKGFEEPLFAGRERSGASSSCGGSPSYSLGAGFCAQKESCRRLVFSV